MSEKEILEAINQMCISSLDPEGYAKWEDVMKQLRANRQSLKSNKKRMGFWNKIKIKYKEWKRRIGGNALASTKVVYENCTNCHVKLKNPVNALLGENALCVDCDEIRLSKLHAKLRCGECNILIGGFINSVGLIPHCEKCFQAFPHVKSNPTKPPK